MKRIMMCLWLLVCSGCALKPMTQESDHMTASENCSTPEWFAQNQPEQGVLVGLGIGLTESEAITSAQASIARQLKSDINSQCIDYEKVELIDQQYSTSQRQSCEHRSTAQETLKRTTVTHTDSCGGVFRVRAAWDMNSVYRRLQVFFKQASKAQYTAQPYRVLSDELISSSEVFFEAAKANNIDLVSVRPDETAMAHKNINAQQPPIAELKVVWQEDGWQLILGREILELTHDEFWNSIGWNLAKGNNVLFDLELAKVKLPKQLETAYLLRLLGTQGEHVTLFNIYGSGNIQMLENRKQSMAKMKTVVATKGEGVLLAVWTKKGIDRSTFPKIAENQDRDLRQLRALVQILNRDDVTSLRSHHYQKISIQ